MLDRTKIRSREYGLVLGQIFIEYLTGSKALHYGLWTSDLPLTVFNLGKAQDSYTNAIVEKIPSGTRRILDVGCGVGAIAAAIVAKGYEIECLSPSQIMNEETRQLLPNITVHDCRFEDFETTDRYDLIIFAESFQYIDTQKALIKCRDLLDEDGAILICDKFKMEQNGRSPIGGGHELKEYEIALEKNGFAVEHEVDLTDQIAPNFDLLDDFRTRVIMPFSAKFEVIQSRNNSFTFGLLLKLLGRMLRRKLHKHKNGSRNAAGFKGYNTYRLYVLRRRW